MGNGRMYESERTRRGCAQDIPEANDIATGEDSASDLVRNLESNALVREKVDDRPGESKTGVENEDDNGEEGNGASELMTTVTVSTLADKLFDLSLELGSLRSRSDTSTGVLLSLSEDLPELRKAIEPILSDLEARHSSCSQAVHRAVFGTPSSPTAHASMVHSLEAKAVCEVGVPTSWGSLSRLATEVADLRGAVADVEGLMAQGEHLRSFVCLAARCPSASSTNCCKGQYHLPPAPTLFKSNQSHHHPDTATPSITPTSTAPAAMKSPSSHASIPPCARLWTGEGHCSGGNNARSDSCSIWNCVTSPQWLLRLYRSTNSGCNMAAVQVLSPCVLPAPLQTSPAPALNATCCTNCSRIVASGYPPTPEVRVRVVYICDVRKLMALAACPKNCNGEGLFCAGDLRACSKGGKAGQGGGKGESRCEGHWGGCTTVRGGGESSDAASHDTDSTVGWNRPYNVDGKGDGDNHGSSVARGQQLCAQSVQHSKGENPVFDGIHDGKEVREIRVGGNGSSETPAMNVSGGRVFNIDSQWVGMSAVELVKSEVRVICRGGRGTDPAGEKRNGLDLKNHRVNHGKGERPFQQVIGHGKAGVCQDRQCRKCIREGLGGESAGVTSFEGGRAKVEESGAAKSQDQCLQLQVVICLKTRAKLCVSKVIHSIGDNVNRNSIIDNGAHGNPEGGAHGKIGGQVKSGKDDDEDEVFPSSWKVFPPAEACTSNVKNLQRDIAGTEHFVGVNVPFLQPVSHPVETLGRCIGTSMNVATVEVIGGGQPSHNATPIGHGYSVNPSLGTLNPPPPAVSGWWKGKRGQKLRTVNGVYDGGVDGDNDMGVSRKRSREEIEGENRKMDQEGSLGCTREDCKQGGTSSKNKRRKRWRGSWWWGLWPTGGILRWKQRKTSALHQGSGQGSGHRTVHGTSGNCVEIRTEEKDVCSSGDIDCEDGNQGGSKVLLTKPMVSSSLQQERFKLQRQSILVTVILKPL